MKKKKKKHNMRQFIAMCTANTRCGTRESGSDRMSHIDCGVCSERASETSVSEWASEPAHVCAYCWNSLCEMIVLNLFVDIKYIIYTWICRSFLVDSCFPRYVQHKVASLVFFHSFFFNAMCAESPVSLTVSSSYSCYSIRIFDNFNVEYSVLSTFVAAFLFKFFYTHSLLFFFFFFNHVSMEYTHKSYIDQMIMTKKSQPKSMNEKVERKNENNNREQKKNAHSNKLRGKYLRN